MCGKSRSIWHIHLVCNSYRSPPYPSQLAPNDTYITKPVPEKVFLHSGRHHTTLQVPRIPLENTQMKWQLNQNGSSQFLHPLKVSQTEIKILRNFTYEPRIVSFSNIVKDNCAC